MIVEIRPSPPTFGRGVLKVVDQAAGLGAAVEQFAEVKRARILLRRVDEIEADAARLRAGGHLDSAIAARYARGEATVDEVLRIAAVAADATTVAALKILDDAVRQANRAVWQELQKAGDKFILALRPPLAPALEEIAALAEAIPRDCVDELAARKRFGTTVAALWARLAVVISRYDRIHDVADHLRQASIVPARRRFAEDYRWLRPDRLAGPNSGQLRNLFVLEGFRRDAQPGIFTETEVRASEAQQAQRQAEAAA